MTRDIVFTPSNLKTFVQCPFKFKMVNLTKEVAYVQGEVAKRGEHLHSMMETILLHGWDSVTWDDDKSRAHAYKFYRIISGLVDRGWELHVEDSVATDGHGHKLEFWDKPPHNLMRCRIDVWLEHKDSDTVIVFDHKSGKKYDIDQLQLQFNAVCLQPVTGRNKYVLNFDYLDNGSLSTEKIDITGVDINKVDAMSVAHGPCSELIVALRGAQISLDLNSFPATKHRFCQWCDVRKEGKCPKYSEAGM